MSDFSNNLRVGDKVYDVDLKMKGLVSDVKESKRMTKVIFDGYERAKKRDVTNLRLIVDGKPEEVAPFDGDLPPAEEKAPTTPKQAALRLVPLSPIESLQAKFDANNHRRETIQKEYVALGKENERLQNAIAALKAV